MENNKASTQLTREQISERRKELEFNHWNDYLESEGVLIENTKIPAYKLFLFNLRSVFYDEDIPFSDYKRGFDLKRWGKNLYDEHEASSINIVGKKDLQYFVDKAKTELLSSTMFPIELIANNKFETHMYPLGNQFFDYGSKICEEQRAWNFLKQHTDIFNSFLEERKSLAIPKPDWETKRKDAIQKKEKELYTSFLQWKKKIVYVGNEDAISWNRYNSSESENPDIENQNDINNGLHVFYSNHANSEKIFELKKVLKIYDLTGTLSYGGHTLFRKFQSEENYKKGIDFIEELILNLEGIVSNESQSNQSIDIVPAEHEFKTKTQKLAWMNELGIYKPILEKCKEGDSYNFSKAANVIHTITDIDINTIRKCLEAIYKPNNENKKNHPFNNPANKIYVDNMIAKYKLKKED